MSKPVQFPVLVTGLSTKVDKSIKVTLETQEMSSQDSAILFDLRGMPAWAVIAPSEIKEEDVKISSERADPAIGQKTPSQRLRAVIFRFWQQTGGTIDFESFYRIQIEGLINKFKDRLHD